MIAHAVGGVSARDLKVFFQWRRDDGEQHEESWCLCGCGAHPRPSPGGGVRQGRLVRLPQHRLLEERGSAVVGQPACQEVLVWICQGWWGARRQPWSRPGENGTIGKGQTPLPQSCTALALPQSWELSICLVQGKPEFFCQEIIQHEEVQQEESKNQGGQAGQVDWPRYPGKFLRNRRKSSEQGRTWCSLQENWTSSNSVAYEHWTMDIARVLEHWRKGHHRSKLETLAASDRQPSKLDWKTFELSYNWSDPTLTCRRGPGQGGHHGGHCDGTTHNYIGVIKVIERWKKAWKGFWNEDFPIKTEKAIIREGVKTCFFRTFTRKIHQFIKKFMFLF